MTGVYVCMPTVSEQITLLSNTDLSQSH